ncbi:Glycosyl hydrolases family 43 [Micromonospora echinospora]|uniref:Glycosyl hydrolases family 43 n=2 Tax=Micromonospora echinospora TaxID=1877 RepID=A0A1C4WJD0_MICEC|nr:family 43 glycosylhydrolase [Micromonospora echinospora]SCE96274.1 Glycosyl hydrolases family 43 [Micromonospora echinospora]
MRIPPILRSQAHAASFAVLATLALVVPAAPVVAGPSAVTAVPEGPRKLIAQGFADPDVVRVGQTWYAYATNDFRHLPVASAPTIDGPWQVLGDAMPGGPGSWAVAGRTWAPDVQPNPDGSLTLTYTAQDAASGRQCIGVAIATSPLGGFVPYGSGPLICPLSQGGAIDANTFVDRNGTRYLTWKNDGNAINRPSTLWVSQVTNNGTTLVGPTTAMLTVAAGQIIEAPDLVQRDDKMVLFYSGGSFASCGYYTSYATAPAVTGPWTPAPEAFMTQANTGLCGPGGADVVTAQDGLGGGDKVVMHAAVADGSRHMYSINLRWVNGLPVQGGSRKSSLDGNGRAEIALIQTDGQIKAWHNYKGFDTMPYGAAAVIGTSFTDPARVRFADLDDDGKSELIHIQADGQIKAWHNDLGFATSPYGNSVVIATGFTDPARVRFTDLDNDGKSELIHIQADGQIKAWHNDLGFAASPYGNSVVIATGFTDPARTVFTDLDDDGRAEIALIQTDGQIKAWHNDLGFAASPYGYTVILATGFTDPARVRFMDLNDDGRAEIALIQTDGQIKAWHNYKGFDTMPYGAAQIIATDFLDPARTIFI